MTIVPLQPLPLPELASPGALDKLLHDRVAVRDLPAIFLAATNADETIYLNQAGERVFGDASKGEVNEDTPCELFSQTKLVTSVAALQLVERGLLDLDDPGLIKKHLPELDNVPILDGYDGDKPVLRASTKPITLRMMLSHTFGSVLPILSPLMTRYCAEHGLKSLFAPHAQVKDMVAPLIFEPGDSFSYGYCIDWAGLLIERVTGSGLDTYFQQNIFAPLKITNMAFYPTKDVVEKKMWVCVRVDGELRVTPHGFGLERAENPEEIELLLGGGALYGSQKEYLAFLRGVLRSDPRYQGTGHRLLSPRGYAELFTSSVPPAGTQMLSAMVNAWIPHPPLATPETINHSVGFALTLEDIPDRRRAGSGFWGGACKTNYWIDPATGVAGLAGTSLRNGEDPWEGFNVEFERVLYDSLKK